ncbi:MAG: hypothetical protein AAF492_13330, partial [Verrucomicrobiota bacterium]
LSGGLLLGAGTVLGDTVNSGGEVAPGLSAGELTITGNYDQEAGGTLHIELGGTTQSTEYDLLNVSGTAQLNGTLELDIIDNFVLQNNDRFEILIAAGITGAFSATNLPPLGSGETFTIIYTATNVLAEFSQPEVDLAITKTVSNFTPTNNEIISYFITVTNLSNSLATGIEVTDQLPAAVTYLGSSDTNYNFVSGIWTIAQLLAGTSATLTITGQVMGLPSMDVTNIATITDHAEFDTDLSNNSATNVCTITFALGAQPDSDNDGLPDSWEIAYGLNPSDPTDCELDPDGDGHLNIQEYWADTHPLEAASILMLKGLTGGETGKSVLWIGGINVTQYIESSTHMDGPWTTILTNRPPTPITNTFFYPEATGQAPLRYFRIRVDQRSPHDPVDQ